MPAAYPQFIPQPFANGASGAFRNTIPNTTAVVGRASFNLGFPPITMQTVISGGKPPLGQDMNGVLYMLSSHSVYQQTGQPYRWSADVVGALAPGGYAVGTLLGSTDGSTLWYNIVNNNVTNPDAGGAGWVAMYAYGTQAIAGLSGGVRNLTAAEAARSVLILTGALVGNVQIIVPNQVRRWLIINNTSGAFSTTVKTAAGTGVIVPQGGFNGPVEVWSDATNVYNVVAPVNLPIDQAATPLTIAQRTSAGYLFAVYFNQSSPVENLGVANVFFDIGDGYHRKISFGNFLAQAFVNAALTGAPTAPTAALGSNDARIANTAYVRNQTLGNAQSWTQYAGTGLRFANVPYANDTGRPIQVAFSVNLPPGTQAFFNVDGVDTNSNSAGGSATEELSSCVTIPPGSVYTLGIIGGAFISNWAELR